MAFTEIRDQNASYAYGGVSVPGSAWASTIYAFEDMFIQQYRHLKRETVAFGDGHIECLKSNVLLGPLDTQGRLTYFKFYRGKKS